MTTFREIANSVISMLKWKEDVTDKYEDRKLPVIDVQMYIDKEDRNEVIKFAIYQKKVANKAVISAHSAMPLGTKYSI